ncbi:ABC transporter permease/M1 family aminopeptidase [Roseateles sp. NT4]|uniref:ABC transporter permease/M1 family aminopeptidase n=1 Tax=Roseateles sp. NT4 TaxID=3453715 RepID=UPI003EED446B
MWLEFLRFDLRLQLRQWLLWVTTLPLMGIAFLSARSDSFRIGGAIGNLHMNAPTVIAQQLTVLSIVAMFLVTAFIAGAVLRDNDAGIADLLFATPMRKLDYLGGRFLAGLAACLLVFALVTLAMVIGSRMPGIAPERLGDFSLWPYAWSFAVFVVPNLLFVAALLMLLAATTRSMSMVYVGVVAFLALWSAASFLGQRPDGFTVGALLDPFGVRVLALATRYFTPAEANTRLPELAGALLANRLLWSAISLGLFAATVVLFKPQRLGTGRAWQRRRAAVPSAAAPIVNAPRRITPRFVNTTAWAQCWQLLRFDARGVLRSLPFLVMLMLAVANFLANYAVGGMRFDSVPYPLTRLMLQEISDGMNFVLVVVLLFYSGELVHRDRQTRIADVGDALPLPDWVPLVARSGTLAAVVLAFLGAGAVVAVGIQLIKGGVDIQPLLYLKGTFINAAYFVLMGLALLALQVMAGNRYAGYAAGAALLASGALLQGARLDDRLYNFASLPPLVYSDMNGYGDLSGWAWFALYWGLGAAALLALAQMLRTRGTPPTTRQRLAAAARALGGRRGLVLATCLGAFTAAQAWIFYNTHVLNRYTSAEQRLDARVDYEKAYRGLLGRPQLSLAALRAEVEIFPAQRAATLRAHYTLRNDTTAPIATLFFQSDVDTDTVIEQLPPHRVTRDDPRFGVLLIELDQPLAPGATLLLDAHVQVRPRGFTNSGALGRIHENGTLFTLEDFFPKLSYDASQELDDPRDRSARGLGAPHRLPALEDAAARQHNYLAQYGVPAGLIDFEATVSTSADQTAIAPGDLQRQWESGGRRYFHYKMASPILPFVSFQSGRWQTRTARWQGVDITVFHDPRHAWNVDRMLAGAQAALAYNSEHFGPYPHKALRIVETPLYQSYARSFPMTVPFSESLGFVSDLREPGGVDHVFYVTAHEVAHQWWGDQAIAANVQGAGLITESLAEYSALMTMKQRFGVEALRPILRFDADEYFRGRGAERVGELPLVRDEGQAYITYRKGSLALMRLKNAIGEAAVNRALGRFIAERRYQGPPYATSLDLLQALRAEAPADQQALIGELFERIVVYDNRVLAATAKPRSDAQWDVTLQLSLARFEADAKGRETPLTDDQAVEVALFAAADRPLYRAAHRLPAGTSTLTVTVKEKPMAVALDPDGLLLDRIPADNRRHVD